MLAQTFKSELTRQRINRIINTAKNSILSKICAPDPLQIYNVWNFPKCDPRYGLDQIVENILYYTEPFDIVVDPMAGGGTTVDVCKAMFIRYQAYDINPIREEIKKHDIRQGFPKRRRDANSYF
jgi:DNA modification methylase